MRVSQKCADCLYDKQIRRSDNQAFQSEIKDIIDHRQETDTAPYLVYLFNEVFTRFFGPQDSYADVKSRFNHLVHSMENELRQSIEAAEDPLLQSMIYARIGNYIDFGAMGQVDSDTFLQLLKESSATSLDPKTYARFCNDCQSGTSFLLLCDNCGEIVLDKLMLEQLRKRFPHLTCHAMLRGKEVLNDATLQDALEIGMDQYAHLISNGKAIGGTIPALLPEDAKALLGQADVILSKGQGNYESLSGEGYHVFYAFLCKCDLFTKRFQVPLLTGMFIEEVS